MDLFHPQKSGWPHGRMISERAARRGWAAVSALRGYLGRVGGPLTRPVWLTSCDQGWQASHDPGETSPDRDGVLILPEAADLPTDWPQLRRVLVYQLGSQRHPPTLRALKTTPPLPTSLLTFFRVYLPFVVEPWVRTDPSRPWISAHLAQTLDGRIAAITGQSQWIGNTANLRHAHRLRALHDGVLVGGKTVLHDDPRLTVRHVAGANPLRVVLSGRGNALNRKGAHLFQDPGCVLLCEEGHATTLEPPHPVQVISVPGTRGTIEPRDATGALGTLGIQSLFVEGGADVVSSFLEAQAVDLLHVHVAPIILGSGIPAFQLPPVATIQEGLGLSITSFNLDGELLIECRLRPQG